MTDHDLIRKAVMLSLALTSNTNRLVFDHIGGTVGTYTHDDYDAAMSALDALVARANKLEKALAHYANEAHWTETTPPVEVNTAGYLAFEYDGGNEFPWAVARAALAGVPDEPVPDPERTAEVIGQLLDRDARAEPAKQPWKGSPDPGSFGGHDYSENERALGYGTSRDPRHFPAEPATEPHAFKWCTLRGPIICSVCGEAMNHAIHVPAEPATEEKP